MYWDHPHIHGEHIFIKSRLNTSTGSPPYTWGALLSSPRTTDLFRITPIYMGSTVKVHHCLLCFQDHPHIHGEHKSASYFSFASLGSPPYTWGALERLNKQQTQRRITPIYMGSTPTKVTVTLISKDHPHIHGEHGEGDFFVR